MPKRNHQGGGKKSGRPAMLDAAIGAFNVDAVKYIDVPEWPGDDGEPSRVYYHPVTLAETTKLMEKHKTTDLSGRPEVLVDLIIMKALDEDGDRIFTVEHKNDLMTKVDPEVLVRIGADISTGFDEEAAGKN